MRRKLTKAEVLLRSRAIIIESKGCADGPKPAKIRKEKDPWADFDNELGRKIRSKELTVSKSGEVKGG
jgi:hypothetical protein